MNQHFALYEPDGRITVTMCNSPQDAQAMADASGSGLLEIGDGVFGATHHVLDGVAVPMPARPALHHVFNYATKQWEDPRTLDDLKSAQWELVKQARTQAEYAGFTWDGSTFDSDATSQNRITGAVALAQMSDQFTIGWVLKDNTVRTLDSLDMMQVGAALGQHVATQFAKGVLLREQIEAATTPEAVAAVVW